MKKTTSITCVFLDIGGVLLTDGWDRHGRARAAGELHLDLAEMEDRHHLTFDTYEEGKLTLEEYLGQVVFYQKRPFTQDQFRHFMFEQSKPYPEMIELITRLKVRYGLKIAVVSNEARELNSYRIREFKLDKFVDCFVPLASCMSASPMRTSSGWPWTLLRRQHGRSSISKTPQCSSRSRKALAFEASFTRITCLLQGNWLGWDYGLTKGSSMKRADPFILTINGGSSSIKFAIYKAAEPLKRRLHGKIDRIGLSGTNLIMSRPVHNRAWKPQPRRP